jgi:ferredoxin
MSAGLPAEEVEVWVDQDLCTGDGLCVQLAPEVFEFDIDGLAYVKSPDGELLTAVGARVPVSAELRLDVITSAKDCPGECIHVARVADGAMVGGPLAD